MFFFKELEIKNCFSEKHVIFRFEANNYANVFDGINSNLKENIIYAVQSFFCNDICLCEVGCNPDCQHGSSLIRIKFIICRIESRRNVTVDAVRMFSQPDVVLYYFDDEQYIDSVKVFHERCQIDVLKYSIFSQYSLNDNFNLMLNCKANSFQLCGNKDKFIELLGDYLGLTNSPQIFKDGRVAKYTQINLLINRECELLKKRTLVDIINEIGNVFRYITWEEYSVKFMISSFDKKINLQDMNWDHINLSKTETWVQKKGCNISCIWNELEPGLKEILKISQMIALGKHLRKNCIFIDDTFVLEKYQNQELIKEAITKIVHTVEDINLVKNNFLGRIIDICNELNITTFINFNTRLPLLPLNTNILHRNTNASEPLLVHME